MTEALVMCPPKHSIDLHLYNHKFQIEIFQYVYRTAFLKFKFVK